MSWQRCSPFGPIRRKAPTAAGAPRNIIEPVKTPEEIPVPLPEDVRLRLRERFSALRSELERLRFETDRRWEELLSRLSENPEEILPQELFRSPSDSPPSRRGTIFLDSVRRLDAAKDQVEVLSRFLEECLRHASRAALLVERDGTMEVWKRAGFAGPSAGRHGSTIPEDPALARKLRCDLVVMGAVSRSGLKRLAVGNTAEHLLDDLSCDLLIVKPPGFATRVAGRPRGPQRIAMGPPTGML